MARTSVQSVLPGHPPPRKMSFPPPMILSWALRLSRIRAASFVRTGATANELLPTFHLPVLGPRLRRRRSGRRARPARSSPRLSANWALKWSGRAGWKTRRSPFRPMRPSAVSSSIGEKGSPGQDRGARRSDAPPRSGNAHRHSGARASAWKTFRSRSWTISTAMFSWPRKPRNSSPTSWSAASSNSPRR